MKISMQYHNPLKGHVSCEHCHTPLEHWGFRGYFSNRDDAHVHLAKEAARAFGETWEPDELNRTPGKYYPHMMKSAAETLASWVDDYLFCPYCGKAMDQPKVCQTLDGKTPLPKVSGNTMNMDNRKRWAEELGRTDAPEGFDKWNDASREQHKVATVVYETY